MYIATCNETNEVYSNNDYHQLIKTVNDMIVENVFYIISKIEYEKWTLIRNFYNDQNYINMLDHIIYDLKNRLNSINENFILVIEYPIQYSNHTRTYDIHIVD